MREADDHAGENAAKRLFALLDNRHPSDYIRRIAVASGGRIIFAAVEEIDWIGAEDNYARLHAGRDVYEVRETLPVVMEKLDPAEFLRIHRSTIVNVRRIRKVQAWFQGSHTIVLQSGEKLRMSRLGFLRRIILGERSPLIMILDSHERIARIVFSYVVERTHDLC